MDSSPFVERLLKKGYEVIFLIEPVDEYCIQALPEFDGKRFQNVAKEGLKFDESEKAKEAREALEKEYEPLLSWLKDKSLKDQVDFIHLHSACNCDVFYFFTTYRNFSVFID